MIVCYYCVVQEQGCVIVRCCYCVTQEQGCVDPLEPKELQQSINLANEEALCSSNSMLGTCSIHIFMYHADIMLPLSTNLEVTLDKGSALNLNINVKSLPCVVCVSSAGRSAVYQ